MNGILTITLLSWQSLKSLMSMQSSNYLDSMNILLDNSILREAGIYTDTKLEINYILNLK